MPQNVMVTGAGRSYALGYNMVLKYGNNDLLYISGDQSVKSAFDTLGQFVNARFVLKQANPLSDGGVQLIFVLR